MDKDDMRDNIARAQGHVIGCGYPDRGCSCAAISTIAVDSPAPAWAGRLGVNDTCPTCYDSGTVCDACLRDTPYGRGRVTERFFPAAGGTTEIITLDEPFAFTLSPTIADASAAPTCAACVEFGTICRPCRKAQWDARRAAERAVERRALRFHIWSSVALGVAVLLLGLFLQSRWDAQCAAEQPGTRWNGDLWACEVAR